MAAREIRLRDGPLDVSLGRCIRRRQRCIRRAGQGRAGRDETIPHSISKADSQQASQLAGLLAVWFSEGMALWRRTKLVSGIGVWMSVHRAPSHDASVVFDEQHRGARTATTRGDIPLYLESQLASQTAGRQAGLPPNEGRALWQRTKPVPGRRPNSRVTRGNFGHKLPRWAVVEHIAIICTVATAYCDR